jgi:hypothetical protein
MSAVPRKTVGLRGRGQRPLAELRLPGPRHHPSGYATCMSHTEPPMADRLAGLGYLKMGNPPRGNSAHGPTAEALNCRCADG